MARIHKRITKNSTVLCGTSTPHTISSGKVTQLQNHSYNSEQGITTLEQVLQLQERNYVLIALSAGAVGGTGTVPSFIEPAIFHFIPSL